MHEKVHESSLAERKGVKIEYGLYLSSAELGLTGRADVVEFHRDGKNNRIPFPIEYKRGRPKPDNCDRVQLCAQALCLEEMLKVNVPEGAFYYGKTRHKQDVAFNDDIRNKTRHTVIELHEYINAGLTAGPVLSRKCKSCSFIDVCMPEAVGRGRSVKKYLDKEMEQAENTGIA